MRTTGASAVALAVLGALLSCSSPQAPGSTGPPPAVVTPDDRPSTPDRQPAEPARLTVGRSAWVSVSVATVWRDPSVVRPVDAPALGHPLASGAGWRR
ncbi:MAG TPA: hypothetical protein VFK52_00890 [Nocardioidaceae bacterium]|nr:hypothetical protein [Nocardioidaceae bacterium]